MVLVNTVTPGAAASSRTAPAPGALQAVFQPPLGKYMAPPAPAPPGPSREVSSLVIGGSAAGAMIGTGRQHARPLHGNCDSPLRAHIPAEDYLLGR